MPKASEMCAEFQCFTCVEKEVPYKTKKSNGRFHHITGISHLLKSLTVWEFLPIKAQSWNGSSLAVNRLDAVKKEFIITSKDSAFERA